MAINTQSPFCAFRWRSYTVLAVCASYKSLSCWPKSMSRPYTDGLLLFLAFIHLRWAALLFGLQNNLTARFQQIKSWRKSAADMTWSTVDLNSTFCVRERQTVRVGVIVNAHRFNQELYALLTVNSHWFQQIANWERAINEKWKYDLHTVLSLHNSWLGPLWCLAQKWKCETLHL